jgi:predicted amino acid racemase
MFLDVLRRRNPRFVEAAIALHRDGRIPANAYVIDLDAVEANTRALMSEADRHGLNVFAMTKQVGRSSGFCRAVRRGGIRRSVAVDMACARATHSAELPVGHLGHLTQVPRAEARAAAALRPDYWTVFNEEKAGEGAAASAAAGYTQPLLARIQADGDTFYRGHEGGFPAREIAAVADRLDRVEGGRFAGITTFPALLSTPKRGGSARRQPGDAGARRRGAGPCGAERYRDQRPRHHLDRRRRGLGRGRCHADRARERLARHDCAPRLRGSAGAPGGALPDRSLAPRRR